MPAARAAVRSWRAALLVPLLALLGAETAEAGRRRPNPPLPIAGSYWDDEECPQPSYPFDPGQDDYFVSRRCSLSWDPVQLVLGNEASRELSVAYYGSLDVDDAVTFLCRHGENAIKDYFVRIAELYPPSSQIHQDYRGLVDHPDWVGACRFGLLFASDVSQNNPWNDVHNLQNILFFWDFENSGQCITLTTRRSHPQGEDPRYVHNWNWTPNTEDAFDDLRCLLADGPGFWP